MDAAAATASPTTPITRAGGSPITKRQLQPEQPMNHHEQKQEARRERLKAAAEKAEQRSAQAFDRAKAATAGIPFGQPILVGHHSEKRHRNALKRQDQAMRRSCEEADRAKELRGRALGVGSGGISSDDPDAIEKLREKLSGMDAGRVELKAMGAAWRKAKKPLSHDREGWTKVADTLGLDLNSKRLLRAIDNARSEEGFLNRGPVPGYVLSNLGANIKRVRERIAQLEAKAGDGHVEKKVGRVLWEEDPDENRLRLYFPGKPSDEARRELKSAGFRWARSVGAWQRQLTDAARASAEYVLRRIEEIGGGF